MKLSEEQLNKAYKRNDQLGDFLDDCAVGILSHGWEPMDYDVADLPNQDIINLVDWWKKKQNEQKYMIQVIRGDYGFLNKARFDKQVRCDSCKETAIFKTKFTKQEIEQLKQRNDIAIDWGKAIIKAVKAVYE